MSILAALRAESIKVKPKKQIRNILLIHLLTQALFMAVYIYGSYGELNNKLIETNLYDNLLSLYVSSMATLVLAVYVSYITTDFIQIDFKHFGFKLMETQALSKANIFLAKALWSLLFIFCFIVIGAVVNAIAGYIIFQFFQNNYLYYAINWADTFFFINRLFLSTLAFFGLITLFMYLIKKTVIINLVVLFSVMAATIANGLNNLPTWLPPYFILNAAHKSLINQWVSSFEFASLFSGIVYLFLAYKLYTKRNETLQVRKHTIFLLSLLLAFVVTQFVTILYLEPRSQTLHERFAIAGHVQSDQPLESIVLLNKYYDTVAQIPIDEKGDFKMVRDSLPSHTYVVIYNNLKLGDYVLDNKDSVYLDVQIQNEQLNVDVHGTIASDQYINSKLNFAELIQFYWIDNLSPDKAAEEITDQANENIKSLKKIVTPDNYTLTNARLQQRMTLIKVSALKEWERYLVNLEKNNQSAFDTLKEPEAITALKSTVNKQDLQMVKYEDYMLYVINDLTKSLKNQQLLPKLQAVVANSEEPMTSHLVYHLYNDYLQSSELVRGELDSVTQYALQNIQDSSIAQNIQKHYAKNQLIMKGEPFPLLHFIDTAMQSHTMEELKGKVVVVDIWATWCQPCNYYYPYFENLALKYASDKVVFLTINIDNQTTHWKKSVAKKSNALLHWFGSSAEITHQLNITGIPRYMIIDKNGKIAYTNAPQPDNKSAYELMLQSLL